MTEGFSPSLHFAAEPLPPIDDMRMLFTSALMPLSVLHTVEVALARLYCPVMRASASSGHGKTPRFEPQRAAHSVHPK